MDALRSHGFAPEALRLAVAVVRSMKRNQLDAHARWKVAKMAAKKPMVSNWDGWIGHALNPIGCLFDTLIEACLGPEDKAKMPHHLGKPQHCKH